jgi:hypothetical protein
MSSVAQILDRVAEGQGKPQRERKEFKPEWLTVHVARVDQGEIRVVQPGSALDVYQGSVILEIRASNHFPAPRYQITVGTRGRGQTRPNVNPRVDIDDKGELRVDMTNLTEAVTLTNYAAQWIATDVKAKVSSPQAQKAIKNRLRRTSTENLDGGRQTRQTGKTERDRAKKRPGG